MKRAFATIAALAISTSAFGLESHDDWGSVLFDEPAEFTANETVPAGDLDNYASVLFDEAAPRSSADDIGVTAELSNGDAYGSILDDF